MYSALYISVQSPSADGTHNAADQLVKGDEVHGFNITATEFFMFCPNKQLFFF